MMERSAGEEGLFAALKNTFATLLGIGRTRAELLVLEIEEEKYRLISMWSKAIAAAFMLAIGLIMAAFALALAFWEYRVLVFGLIAAGFMIGALTLVFILRQQMTRPSKLFRSSLSELDADIAALRGNSAERGE